MLPIQVEFAECSAKGQAEGEADLDAVEKWLEKIAWNWHRYVQEIKNIVKEEK